MFNILIVEDEQIERETLHSIIKRNITSCKEVYVAKNGYEAIALYKKYEPRIVLADINIPGKNGLEVIKEIKTYSEDVVFLILSSYNYFEYAQEALRLGADDYILKPYNIQALIEAVQKLVQKQQVINRERKQKTELVDKIEKIIPVMEHEVLYAILSNENEVVLKKMFRLLDPSITCGFCLIIKAEQYDMAYIDEVIEIFTNEGQRCICDTFHGLYILFILSNVQMNIEDIARLEKTMNGLEKEGYIFRAGPIANDVKAFHHSYVLAHQRLEITVEHIALMKDSGASEKVEDFPCASYVEASIQCFQNLDEAGVKQIVHNISIHLLAKDQRVIVESISSFFEALLKKIDIEYPQVDTDLIALHPLEISNNAHQEALLYVTNNLNNLYHLVLTERFKNTNHLVKQALKYIEQNYRKPITLGDMAQALEVSPYYISKLLNKYGNKNFTELVSQRRVEASKELLKTNKRIKEIAYEVGFQGQNYFTKIFKKYTGMTPKMYKQAFDDDEYHHHA